jgi:hypothetical protein
VVLGKALRPLMQTKHIHTVYVLQCIVYLYNCMYAYVQAVADAKPSVFRVWLWDFPTLCAG